MWKLYEEKNMKTMIKMALIGAVLACGVEAAQTQTVSMVANISLTGFRSVDANNAAAVRLTSKDILAALNATGNFSFGKTAQIVFLSVDDEMPTVGVREQNGANVTITDVSSFFSISEAVEVHGNNNATSYAAQTYNFDNQQGTSFSVSGATTLRRGPIGSLNRVRTLSSQVAGFGTIGGADMVVRGNVSAGSAKIVQ